MVNQSFDTVPRLHSGGHHTSKAKNHIRGQLFFFSFFLSWLSNKTAPCHTHYLYLSLSVSLFFGALARRQLCAVLIDGVTQALQRNIFELLIKRREAGRKKSGGMRGLTAPPHTISSALHSFVPVYVCAFVCARAGLPYTALMRKAGGMLGVAGVTS